MSANDRTTPSGYLEGKFRRDVRYALEVDIFTRDDQIIDEIYRLKKNEREYLKQFPMSDAQRDAILARDWNKMISLGGNIYYTSKLGATDGLGFQQVAAIMTGKTQEAYAQMMINGGRSIKGARTKSEWKGN